MKTVLIILTFLLSNTGIVHASLGDLEATARIKYGKPLDKMDPIAPASFAWKYHWKSYNVVVGFAQGSSSYEIYEKDNREAILDTEIQDLLNENGADWKLIEQGLLTKNTLWETADKTKTAVYSETSKTLSVKIKDSK